MPFSATAQSLISLQTTRSSVRGNLIYILSEPLPPLSPCLSPLSGAAGIEVIAVSADKEAAASEMVEKHKVPFSVGCGLSEDQIRTLGTFASDPTDYIPQKHSFSEPAWFLLNADQTIKYLLLSLAVPTLKT